MIRAREQSWNKRRRQQQHAWEQARAQRKMRVDHLLEFIRRGSGYRDVLKQMAMKRAMMIPPASKQM